MYAARERCAGPALLVVPMPARGIRQQKQLRHVQFPNGGRSLLRASTFWMGRWTTASCTLRDICYAEMQIVEELPKNDRKGHRRQQRWERCHALQRVLRLDTCNERTCKVHPSPSFPSNDFESQKLFNLAIFPVCRDRRDCIVDLLLSSRKDDPAGALWLMTLGASQ